MELEAAIRTRRSEHRLIEPAPSDEEFVELLAWAATAPDHGRLRPWRWILVRGDSRAALGVSFASGATDAETVRREMRKPLRAPLLATLVFLPQRNHRVPDWEQLAASSAMVNSLMLLLHDRGSAASGAPARPSTPPGPGRCWPSLRTRSSSAGSTSAPRIPPGVPSPAPRHRSATGSPCSHPRPN